MPELIAALDAFVQEHRRRDELDGRSGDDVVWMSCESKAWIAYLARDAQETLDG
ncbi:MAG: hypothetical protein WEG40_15680 [Candidatus Rokuibacteriota bacterium]